MMESASSLVGAGVHLIGGLDLVVKKVAPTYLKRLHYYCVGYVAVCRPDCLHGDCTAPGRCNCHVGWRGQRCQNGRYRVKAPVMRHKKFNAHTLGSSLILMEYPRVMHSILRT